LVDGVYRFKAGMALTSEVLYGLLRPEEEEEADAIFDQFENPPVARPTLDWLNTTSVFEPIGGRNGTCLPWYEERTEAAHREFLRNRDEIRAFGHLNFGDYYSDGQMWMNSAYDPAWVECVEYLRGGDPQRWLLARQMARHLADVDTVNFSSVPSQIGLQVMHMPGHVGGYHPPYFRTKMAASRGEISHTSLEGMVAVYLLSGDENLRETLQRTKDWLLSEEALNHYDFTTLRYPGWHLTHLAALATGFDDPGCLDAAAIIAHRVRARQDADGGWVRMLLPAHCSRGAPRCRGEVGFMVALLLAGLRRYHRSSKDEHVAETIVNGTHWLTRHCFSEVQGQFSYSSCPLRNDPDGPSRCRGAVATTTETNRVAEALAYGYRISQDPDIKRFLDLALVSLEKSRIPREIRFVPQILAMLVDEHAEPPGTS
jgi:hypothetical protein